MVLPSRKDYPDYYQVIMEPIDMTMIEAKLRADKVRHPWLLLNYTTGCWSTLLAVGQLHHWLVSYTTGWWSAKLYLSLSIV